MNERIVVSLTSADQEYQALQGEDARGRAASRRRRSRCSSPRTTRCCRSSSCSASSTRREDERPAALLVHTRVPTASSAWRATPRGRASAGCCSTGRRPTWSRCGASTRELADRGGHDRPRRDRADPRPPAAAAVTRDGRHVLYVQGPADASAARLRLEGFEEALARARPTSSRSSTASGPQRAPRRRSRPGCGSRPRSSSRPTPSCARTTTWRAAPAAALELPAARVGPRAVPGLRRAAEGREARRGRRAASPRRSRCPPAPAPRSSSW